jgi:uncharacterized membrane protein YqiK
MDAYTHTHPVQVILTSEASRQAAINQAAGEAEAITKRATATAAGLRALAAELTGSSGAAAAQLRVAEQYVEVCLGAAEVYAQASRALTSVNDNG